MTTVGELRSLLLKRPFIMRFRGKNQVRKVAGNTLTNRMKAWNMAARLHKTK